MSKLSLPPVLVSATLAGLPRHPEPLVSGGFRPVHTVYGGAHLFRADGARKLGDLAVRAVEQYAPDGASFAAAMGLPAALGDRVRPLVLSKLAREPVEDLRIDFEDGYGLRPDEEEDGHAVAAARAMAAGVAQGTLPVGVGIRIKCLGPASCLRAIRTLDLFLTAFAGEGVALPPTFVVTLPKVERSAEIAALVGLLAQIEASLGWPRRSVGVELMIETPGALVGPGGLLTTRALVEATRGRCRAVHFGTYDFTAALGVAASHQRPDLPACDLARSLLQLSLAGTGVRISDGATATLPVAPHRGEQLSAGERAANHAAVTGAWRLHAANVTRALSMGILQGWDLHPAQLPARYAAVFAFFLEEAGAMGERLTNFLARAGQASLVGTAFDDAATGEGLVQFFSQARAVGALTPAEIESLAGVRAEELELGGFTALLRARRGG